MLDFREMYVLYVSTNENVIKKISVLPRTMKTCVLEIWKPLPDSSNKILSMHFLRQTVGAGGKILLEEKKKNSCS